MVDSIQIILLASHLLLLNVAIGGPLVCCLLEWWLGQTLDGSATAVARRLADWAFGSLLLGVGLGALMVAAMWLADNQKFFQAVAVVPQSRLWFSLGEVGFSAVLLWLYRRAWRVGTFAKWRNRALVILSSTNLAYHFPLLFTAIAELSTRPELWGRELTRGELRQWLFSPMAVALAVHVTLASLAVAGVAVMLLAKRRHASPNALEAAAHDRLIGLGAWVALSATTLQLPVGLWLLLSTGELARNRLLGDHWPAATAFAAGVLSSLWLLNVLLGIALGERERQKLRIAPALLVATVVFMTTTLHLMRG